jgi:type IV pilus assembly protein PilM
MLKDHRILALDIGASSIKLAEFVPLKAGGIELVKFAVGTLDVESQSDADRLPQVTATIRDLLRTENVKPGPVQICVSGQSVFSRFVKLPPVDKEKVYQIILYEAQQNVPFPIEEVVWDYQLIGRGEGELDVMLAAIKADIIVHLTDAVEQAGLRTDLVDVAPMALYNAVRYNYGETAGCVLIIDIGARSTDLIFMEEGRVFIRSVPVAGNAITQQIMREFELSFDDAEEMKRAHAYVAFGGAFAGPKSEVADNVSKIVRSVMTRMHAEVDRSIKFYRSQQNGGHPRLILLTGGCSIIPYTDTFLKEKLKVDVDYLNPFINVPVSEGINAEEIGRHAHELAEVVGVALRKTLTCPIEINLLPPNVVAEKAFRRKQPFLLSAAFGVVMLVVVWCAFFLKTASLAGEKAQQVEARVAALQAVDTPLRATLKEVGQINGKIDTLRELAGKRTNWLRILGEIQKAMPPDLWLTSVAPVRPELPPSADPATPPADPGVAEIEVTGMGYIDQVSSETIIAFRDALRASEIFGDKTEITFQPRPVKDAYTRDFKIVIALEKPITT